MNYIKVSFILEPLLPTREILYADLSDTDFESFEESEKGLNAYVQEDLFTEDQLKEFMVFSLPDTKVDYTVEKIEQQNWNAVWESNFEPIQVNDNCVIRAPFHDIPKVEYDILISPQMSFGTGHHETTFLISNELFHMDVKGKSLLDMGCGTAVLAIIASKLGADPILGIDIEEWAYENALENCSLNQCNDVIVEKGDSQLLDKRSFQIILANINKNVLLKDLPVYANCLAPRGIIVMSGFFDTDVSELGLAAEKVGLEFVKSEVKNNWAMLVMQKTN